jgi:uncharacterized protein YifN (PemK superfamily)
MAIQFPVAPGTILLCDYGTGFQVPEMVKRRPAVVVSPRLPHRDGLCTVVPLSGSPPDRDLPYQCKVALPAALPTPFEAAIWWAKADMLATVGFRRLDMFRTARDHTGRRKYLQPKISAEDLMRIRTCIVFAVGGAN